MKLIPTKQEQHGLASRWLHEIAEWEPPRFRRRKPPPQLEGQLDLIELVVDAMSDGSQDVAPATTSPATIGKSDSPSVGGAS